MAPLSTRCQIEFRRGEVRRTIYRHWDGYPSAVIPDLLAFIAWSTRRGDVEYETANFLYWSKRDLGASEQLGFGVCANDEFHCDIEYYYVVAWEQHGVRITAHAMEHDAGEVRLGKVVRSAVYTPPARKEETPSATLFNAAATTGAIDGVRALRKERSWTQERLAEAADLHENYISRLESGDQEQGLFVVVRLRDALRTTPDWLLEGLSGAGISRARPVAR